MMKVDAERKLVVILFVLVLITFSFAQRDSKRYNPSITTIEQVKAKLAQAPANWYGHKRFLKSSSPPIVAVFQHCRQQ